MSLLGNQTHATYNNSDTFISFFYNIQNNINYLI